MKEKKLFGSIEGIDGKFVNEALKSMREDVDYEEAEYFESAAAEKEVYVKKSHKSLLFRGIIIAAEMCAVVAAVIALNNFGGRFNLFPAQTVGTKGAEASVGEVVSESELIDTDVTEETSKEEMETTTDETIDMVHNPLITSPTYAAAEKYFTVEKAELPSNLSSYDFLTGNKIFFRRSGIEGKEKELSLIYYDIMTGKEEILIRESSEYEIHFYPICEYNGHLYFYRFLPNSGDPLGLYKISISDKTVQRVIDSITFNADFCSYPRTVCSGNVLYIERTVGGENDCLPSYNIDIYNMDTGELSTFKEQAKCPRVFKGGVAYMTEDAICACDAVTGENEKKICDLVYDWESCMDLIYSDGETLFYIKSLPYEGEYPDLYSISHFIFEVFDGEKFESIAVFLGSFRAGYPDSFICSDDFIVFETYVDGALKQCYDSEDMTIIYDKKSGEFITLDSENGYKLFYSSGDTLYYSEYIYNDNELAHVNSYKLTRK